MLFEDIKNKIEQYDKISIYRHIQADGDAYGSSFGLKELIRGNYPEKDVRVYGAKVSYLEGFFPELDEEKEENVKGSLVIVLDTPNVERIEGFFFDRGIETIKIDHHIFVEEFAQLELVDTTASSACELVTLLATTNHWRITSEAASYLYYGITTDAGRFLYSYTPRLFECAKALVEAGAEVSKIYPFIYEVEEENARFHGFCQSHFEKTPFGVAYNKLTPELLEANGFNKYEGSGMVNALSNIKDIEIWAHFSENEDGTVRGELRSKGLPVNEIAEQFGGGGHKQAAGCTLLNWDEVDVCLERLDRMILESKPYYDQLQLCLDVGAEASKIVMDIYNSTYVDVEIKEDDSPVTQADKNSDTYIRKMLHEAYPEYGLLSEETADDLSRTEKEYCWIIDPVDGTKDFIAKDNEFCINIALARNGEIVVGVIVVPALNITYFATKGGGAYRNDNGKITRVYASNNVDNLIGLQSKFHTNKEQYDYYKQYSGLITSLKAVGSAYKFGLIADGTAHIYMKFGGQTKEWDIAPGVVLLEEAGGFFAKPNGELFQFNKKDYHNHEGFVVMAKYNKGLLVK